MQRGDLLRMDYIDRDGKTTRRRVLVYATFTLAGEEYLVAWCYLRAAWRTFRWSSLALLGREGDPNACPVKVNYAKLAAYEVECAQALVTAAQEFSTHGTEAKAERLAFAAALYAAVYSECASGVDWEEDT